MLKKLLATISLITLLAVPLTSYASVSFNGTSQYVDTGSWSNSLTNITVCTWVKPTSGTRQDIVSKWTTNQYQYDLLQGVTASKFTFYISTNGSAALSSANSVTSIVAGVWYFVCGSYDGANIKLYVNGSQEGSNVAQTGNLYGSSVQNNLIGKSADAAFSGSIDDVRIYNRALSAQEVRALYLGGNVSNYGLIEWLPLYGIGSQEIDLSGKRNNGTPVGYTGARKVSTVPPQSSGLYW